MRFFLAALVACSFLHLSPLVEAANSASYEQITSDQASPIVGPELENIKASLVGVQSGVIFINTEYLVNARLTGGVSFLRYKRSNSGDRRPPRKNILPWTLGVAGRLEVTSASLAEIDVYNDKMTQQVEAQEPKVRELNQRYRNAEGDAKEALRQKLANKRVALGDKKRSLRASQVIRAAFADAMNVGIETMYIAVLRAESVTGINYDERSDSIKNLEHLAKRITLRQPMLIHKDGFYLLGPDYQSGFKRVGRAPEFEKARASQILNMTYDAWGERCARLRKHEALLPDSSLLQHCSTTQEQLLSWPGVIARSPHYVAGEVDLPTPTSAEENLFLQPTGANAELPNSWPVLDYTTIPNCNTVVIDYEKIRARGFKDTLWGFERVPRYTAKRGVAGKNWSADTNQRYRASAWLGAYIYLREDGVVGINNVYDRRHRWSWTGEQIELTFFDKAIQLTIKPGTGNWNGLRDIEAHDDRLYIYRAHVVKQYSGRIATRYSLNSDYLQNLPRRISVPKAEPLCVNGKPRTPSVTHTSPAQVKPVPVPKASNPAYTHTQQPDLLALINGSFEEPMTNQYQFGVAHWAGERHGVVVPPKEMFPHTPPGGGRQLAFLSKAGAWMSQELAVTANSNWRYTLQFFAGTRLEPGFTEGEVSVELRLGDTLVASHLFRSPPKGQFSAIELHYEAPENPPSGPFVVFLRNEVARQVNFDLVNFWGYPPADGERPPTLQRESHSTAPNKPTPPETQTADTWETVGYWDYDGQDGQAIPSGLILREQPGEGLGQSWQRIIELKNHHQLKSRPRNLWPVQFHRLRKQVCINYPGYPSYTGFVDAPGEAHDGIYAFGPCE